MVYAPEPIITKTPVLHEDYPQFKKSVEKHTHRYTKLEGQRVRPDNKRYQGSTGDKAILYRVCKCGDKYAIEFGTYKAMQRKLQELRNV